MIGYQFEGCLEACDGSECISKGWGIVLVSPESDDRGNAVYAEFDGNGIGRTMRLSLGVDRGYAVYAEFLAGVSPYTVWTGPGVVSQVYTVFWHLQY